MTQLIEGLHIMILEIGYSMYRHPTDYKNAEVILSAIEYTYLIRLCFDLIDLTREQGSGGM